MKVEKEEKRKEGRENSPVDDVRHRSRSVGSENLDGDNVSLLGDTVLPRSDGSSAVSSYGSKIERRDQLGEASEDETVSRAERTVSVSILVDIVLRDGLSPRSSSLELDVVNVDSSINDV